MKKCDILVIGASTTGCWFAHKMAKNGFDVTVIEKEEADNVSRAYDIFHMGEADMKRFDLEIPDENDEVFGFTFDGSTSYSPYGNYPKRSKNKTVGLHKHGYIMKMAQRATQAGAKIIYGAPFKDFLFDENGKRIGAKFETEKGEQEIQCSLVADCSGIPSVARTKLPDSSPVENFALKPEDIFYVVLYYVKYAQSVNPRALDGFFMQYKAWSAPSGDEHGAILGVGGSYGYDYAEEIFKDFKKNVPWPEYTVDKIEKGMTPYHRTLYSFVDDGFIAMGDTALLTKPTCGEGCTSSLFQAEIAVDVISDLLKSGKQPTKENMWSINKRYIDVQGKAFDSLRPLLFGIITANYDEAEYLFKNDVLFSQKILGGMGENLNLTAGDIAKMVAFITAGVVTKKLRQKVVTATVKGLLQSVKLGAHYDKYPETFDGFAEWKKEADRLWEEIGTVADTCDKELLKKLGKI